MDLNLNKKEAYDKATPKLFTVVLEEVFRQLNWEKKGIMDDGENLSHIKFADVLAIFFFHEWWLSDNDSGTW